MIKNVLIPLTGFSSDAGVLEAGAAVAVTHSAILDCLHVQPAPMGIVSQAALLQFGSRRGNVELLRDLQRNAERQSQDAKACFDRFADAHKAIATTWQLNEGDPLGTVTAEARYSDLVLFARGTAEGEFSGAAVASVLVHCGRPVLLVPDHPLKTLGSTIAIAWKETAEAARAVSAAMPFLRRAKHILVLSVEETGAGMAEGLEAANRLAKQLRRHGLEIDAHWIVAGERPVSEVLSQTARAAGADLLVVGAYSHSRFRELVFGGVTRGILQECDVPVLFVH